MTSAEVTSAAHGTAPRTHGTLLDVKALVQEFRVSKRGSFRKGTVSAVAGVSFEIMRGETFAVVGETSSGKSTLARALIRAPGPKGGTITLNGHELTGPRAASMREVGQLAQMIFQDPFSALNPKWTIEKIITEPLATSGMPKGT